MNIARSLRERGLLGTARLGLAVAGLWWGRLWGEIVSYKLRLFFGPERAAGIMLVVFRFRNRQRCCPPERLWMGRSLHEAIFRVRYINPADVTHGVKGGIVPYIQDGDWDLARRELPLNETVTELFVEHKLPPETAQYRRMRAAVEAEAPAYWCRTPEDVDRYFQVLLDTFEDISKSGYRTAQERRGTATAAGGYYPDEVLVSIGRDGELLLESGGTHRLSMAKLLVLEAIPAVVVRRHYRYTTATGDWLG
ncbi:hypothetical protein ACFLW1_00645 [Chloroflexota bacterium]